MHACEQKKTTKAISTWIVLPVCIVTHRHHTIRPSPRPRPRPRHRLILFSMRCNYHNVVVVVVALVIAAVVVIDVIVVVVVVDVVVIGMVLNFLCQSSS